MEDVNGAAPAAAETSGVPIEQAQSKPAPVENRAPEAPQPAEKPSATVDEALRKAVERHTDKPADKKAEAKGGDDAKAKPERSENKPAEKAPADERTEAKAPQKAEGEGVDDKPTRERAADGKFAARAQEGEGGEEGQTAADKQPQKASRPAPFKISTPEEQADWDNTPESVRTKITTREQEVSRGFQQYRTVVEPLKPFLEAAQANKTTLHEALQRYTAVEQALQRDPVNGLMAIGHEMGIDIRAAAEKILGMSQEQSQHSQQRYQADQENAALRRQLEELTSRQQSFEQEQRYTASLGEVNAFAAQHEDFEDYAEPIADLVQRGYALEDAYIVAKQRFGPARSATTREQPLRPAPAQDAHTVQARKTSITGAPSAGSSTVTKPLSKNNDEALRRAFAALA